MQSNPSQQLASQEPDSVIFLGYMNTTINAYLSRISRQALCNAPYTVSVCNRFRCQISFRPARLEGRLQTTGKRHAH